MEATFCFVDIAGFTALTETHGATAAADLIDRFMELVRDALPAEGKVVDRAGDAVFVIVPRPEQAIQFTSRLFHAAFAEVDFPVLRAGLHHGEALERDGAYFGPDVNLAARVAAEAGGGKVLGTQVVADAAARAGFDTTSLGMTFLRNVRTGVELFSLDVSGEATSARIDPVCRMRVDPAHAPGRLRFAEDDYWFCSLRCAGLFAQEPEKYLELPKGDQP